MVTPTIGYTFWQIFSKSRQQFKKQPIAFFSMQNNSKSTLLRNSSVSVFSKHLENRRRKIHLMQRDRKNPFVSDELLQRIGGNAIRNLKNSYSSKIYNELIEEDLKNEIWHPVYRFNKIRLYSAVSKLKIYQTAASFLLLPYCYYKFMMQDISGIKFCVLATVGVLSPFFMLLFTNYFNRIIGVISINDNGNILRIGHLSFWGTRENKYIELEDIVPLNELSNNPNKEIVRLERYSNDKGFFLLSTSNVEIVDEEKALLIFGTNEPFSKHGAKFYKRKEKDFQEFLNKKEKEKYSNKNL